MNIQEYQKAARQFANYGGNPNYAFSGLAEEAGEVLGKYAKFIRKHAGAEPDSDIEWSIEHRLPTPQEVEDTKKFYEDLKKELGDVCWFVAELCSIYGLDLESVMQGNIDKLTDRKKRGVIIGEGDNR